MTGPLEPTDPALAADEDLGHWLEFMQMNWVPTEGEVFSTSGELTDFLDPAALGDVELHAYASHVDVVLHGSQIGELADALYDMVLYPPIPYAVDVMIEPGLASTLELMGLQAEATEAAVIVRVGVEGLVFGANVANGGAKVAVELTLNTWEANGYHWQHLAAKVQLRVDVYGLTKNDGTKFPYGKYNISVKYQRPDGTEGTATGEIEIDSALGTFAFEPAGASADDIDLYEVTGATVYYAE